jgi:serine/threonine protein kinase
MLELQVLSYDHVKRHQNIAELLAVSWHSRDGNIYPILVMELACEEHPTMAQLLSKLTPLATRLELIRDVLEGLSALHDLYVVYGDIKPENVLIFRSSSVAGFTAKLSDFGFCKPTEQSLWEPGGTPYWNAPECLFKAPDELKAHQYSNSRDIYTFGLLASYVITEDMPFGSLNIEKISELKLGDKVAQMVSSKWRIVEPLSTQIPLGSRHQDTDSTVSAFYECFFATPIFNAIFPADSERFLIIPGTY